MITAKEARMQSDKNYTSPAYSEICSLIQNKINFGMTVVFLDKDLSNRTSIRDTQMLRSLGYTVDWYAKDGCRISW